MWVVDKKDVAGLFPTEGMTDCALELRWPESNHCVWVRTFDCPLCNARMGRLENDAVAKGRNAMATQLLAPAHKERDDESSRTGRGEKRARRPILD